MIQALWKKIVPEWKTMYIDALLLKKNLEKLKRTTSLTSEVDTQNTRLVLEKHWELFLNEVEKAQIFFQYISGNIEIKDQKYWFYIQGDFKLPRIKTQKAYLLLYKEATQILKYVDTNRKIMKNILEKTEKFIHQVKQFQDTMRFKDIIQSRKISYCDIEKILQIQRVAFQAFINLYTEEKSKQKAEKKLLKLTKEPILKQKTVFYMGIWMGAMIVLIVVIAFYVLSGYISPQYDDEFGTIFPVYRGSFMFLLYMWILAWNVWGWNTFHVNYKKIFKFNFHFSSLEALLKRFSSFSTVFLVSFFLYAALRLTKLNTIIGQGFSFTDFFALIPWISFLIYFFIPAKVKFNGQGRRYFFHQFKKVIFFCVYEVDFTINWISDQFVSLVKPFQDLSYSVCYYTHTKHNNSLQQSCGANQVLPGVIIANIPLILRMIQCLKLSKKKKILFGDDFYNFGKYFFAMCASLFSFFYVAFGQQNSHIFLYLWLILAIFSSVYSFYWDYKKDWGIISFHQIRDNMSYNKQIYYFAILMNLFFRFIWILSISQEIVNYINVIPNLFPLIIGSIEIFRRGIWNFFRVEKEHLVNCGKLEAVGEIQFRTNYHTHKEKNDLKDQKIDNQTLLRVGSVEQTFNIQMTNNTKKFNKELNKRRVNVNYLKEEAISCSKVSEQIKKDIQASEKKRSNWSVFNSQVRINQNQLL